MSEGFSPPGFWSCAKDAPLGHVSRALGVPEAFCVEVSAHGWHDPERVMEELARAFSFPAGFGRTWDAANDCLAEFRDSRPQLAVVFRDIPDAEAARGNVARAAQRIEPGIVVLDGWDRPDIELGWPDKRRVAPVRALKTS